MVNHGNTDFTDLEPSSMPEAPAPGTTITPEEHAPEARRSQATELLELCERLEFFHDGQGEAYVTLRRGNHHETWPLRSRSFRDFLALRFYRRHRRTPGSSAVDEALGTLSGRACFDGPQRSVALRVAQQNNRIYLDLCNERWQGVEITAAGWQLIDNPPVRFVRRRGMLALPEPIRHGQMDELWPLLNLTDSRARMLVWAWLIGALRPSGPYPVLVLQGEQGTAKTTVAKMLRALVDPGVAAVRTVPRNESDLLIAARNRWVIALDNLSGLQPWLSDALCRLATGGGFSTRELYTNLDEVFIEVQRPCILNGIDDICTRDDLIDRAIIVNLEPIADTTRKPEAELWEAFERIRPAVLGALLDAVATALGRLRDIPPAPLPRMADFTLWARAAEPVLGVNDGAFDAAYSSSRQSAIEDALDGSAVANTLRRMMDTHERWEGTATELLARLDHLADTKIHRLPSWPKGAKALSSELRRLAPALRSVGIVTTWDRSASQRTVTLERVHNSPSFASRASPVAPETGDECDARIVHRQPGDATRLPSPVLRSTKTPDGDANDGNDTRRTENPRGERP